LASHQTIRSLLLENNEIKYLPIELSQLKQLTALSLIDNPIEFPPMDIIKKGLKSILQFLNNEMINHNIQQQMTNYESKSMNYDRIDTVDDCWASDDDQDDYNNNNNDQDEESLINKSSLTIKTTTPPVRSSLNTAARDSTSSLQSHEHFT
jgi:hypothetical protein